MMAGQAPIHDECSGSLFFTFGTEKNNMVEMGHSLWWAEKPCTAKATAHSVNEEENRRMERHAKDDFVIQFQDSSSSWPSMCPRRA